MADRAGSFNNASPDWRGVIRRESWPIYVCLHRNHTRKEEAIQCARNAVAFIRANGKLPERWLTYENAKVEDGPGII